MQAFAEFSIIGLGERVQHFASRESDLIQEALELLGLGRGGVRSRRLPGVGGLRRSRHAPIYRPLMHPPDALALLLPFATSGRQRVERPVPPAGGCRLAHPEHRAELPIRRHAVPAIWSPKYRAVRIAASCLSSHCCSTAHDSSSNSCSEASFSVCGSAKGQ